MNPQVWLSVMFAALLAGVPGFVPAAAAPPQARQASASKASISGPPELDFEFFRARVQPIFLREHDGLARCYACHSQGTPLRLQPLSAGSASWNDEESRRNFEAVRRVVVPGNPLASRLLTMPLATEVGGAGFHPGGKHWTSQSDPEWQTLATWVRGEKSTSPAAQSTPNAAPVRIVQTNSAGNNIHLIDPATNTVVAEITGIEVNHGAAVAPDGRQLYFSNEADHTLDIVSAKTLAVIKKVALSGRPNNVAIGRDGRHVYVAIVSDSGAVDVIDTASMERIKSIATRGGVHNTYVTPDGKYVVAGSIVGKKLTVIDSAREEPLWSLDFDNGVRPMAFERNADGSTRRLFVQISDFHGFAIVDFAQRKEVGRVTLPDVPPGERHMDGLQGSPSHGIGVAPDGQTLWVNSKMNDRVYAYSLPDLKLLGGVRTGHDPDWLTFTPDSKSLYVANAGSNSVSVVDVASRKEVTRIAVGQVPKRNITAVLPTR
jgi:YVTN family beta-propeller protein